jgi:signal transduction histidine kinase
VRDANDNMARLAVRLAARTAHDLNNVAAVFSGHIYLLRNAAETSEEALAAMETVMEHLARLTGSLMAFGTLGTEEAAAIDINDVVRSAAKTVQAAAPVELDLDPDLPAVSGRRGDLERALEALVSNSREASDPDRPIRVSTRRDPEGSLQITVEDAGKGVPSEVRRRNFEPLFSTKGEKGHGIGLAIASTVAALHGGSLEIEDRPEGGTRATLRILP